MQSNINIMDKDDSEAIRYPTIKNEGEEDASERRVTMSIRDITIPGVKETVYFPLDFCMENIVINSVAKKYEAGIEYYPYSTDEEHFLLGFEACGKERKNLNCPYMKKANKRIDSAQNINHAEIFAVYLLSLDDSNENRQKFLIMTKSKVHVLYDTQSIESYDYENIRFTPDGVKLNYIGESAEQNIFDYSFDERFLNFAREFMLMRCTTLVDVRERHPFANVINDRDNPDMIADMNINVVEIDRRPAIRKRHHYLRFLVDTAAAEGYLEAKTIMRLCYMAREFRISADYMRSWLKNAEAGGIRKNKLQSELVRILNFIGVKYKFVFIQDLLEAGTDKNGKFHRQELLKILKRSQFGLEKFVESYLEFIGKRNVAENELQMAFQNVTNKEICFKHSVRAQNYASRMNLQMVTMGAILNEQ